MSLTQNELREFISYDFETGRVTWIKRPSLSSPVVIGTEIGWPTKQGYRRVKIYNRSYLVHRLIWLYVTGEWPPNQIDHVNLDPSDNRWANLRLATRGQNGANRFIYRNNPTGFKGVSIISLGRWRAIIKKDGKTRHLGCFTDPVEAHFAYQMAACALHREFARW